MNAHIIITKVLDENFYTVVLSELTELPPGAYTAIECESLDDALAFSAEHDAVPYINGQECIQGQLS